LRHSRGCCASSKRGRRFEAAGANQADAQAFAAHVIEKIAELTAAVQSSAF
jgi:hypothetical protein